jgi:hypothetical protein
MDANDRNKRIERIRAQRDQLRARMNSLLGQERADQNRNLARKAKILGETILGEAAENEKTKLWMTQFLDKRLTSDRDRALFDLPPSKPKPPAASNGDDPKGVSQ